MKISLIAAAALTSLVAACTPPQSTPQETEAEVTKKLGLNGGECLQCAQNALEGACQTALDDCAADLEACLDGSAIEDVALCIVGECGASCVDDGGAGGGGPSTDPITGSGAGGTGSTSSGDPGDIPDGLGGGGSDGGGGGDTCPPDDDDCGGCDDDCDLDAVCDDLLACGEECWFSTADEEEFIDCLINVCGATEDLADECDL